VRGLYSRQLLNDGPALTSRVEKKRSHTLLAFFGRPCP
jgi:hypothetical protein